MGQPVGVRVPPSAPILLNPNLIWFQACTCRGGPPWPPLTKAALVAFQFRGVHTEGHPYRPARNLSRGAGTLPHNVRVKALERTPFLITCTWLEPL